VYPSPARGLSADIIPIGKPGSRNHESRVEIRKSDGSLVAREDNTSEDGEHGMVVDLAAWTQDSQFFVVSGEFSGGHGVWQSPIFFYDRKDDRVHPLDDYLPPTADPRFELRPPDIIQVSIWTHFREGKGIDGSIALPISFQLSDILERKCRRPDELAGPCKPNPSAGSSKALKSDRSQGR